MRFWPRNNENVLIVGRVLADIRDLLVYVTFNATAQRRIKLRQIADFQGIGSASANRITRNAKSFVRAFSSAVVIARLPQSALANRQLVLQFAQVFLGFHR